MNTSDNLAKNEALASGGLDALFAASLDDLDDLPSFVTPTPGVYILSVSLEEKEVNDKPSVEAKFVVVEAVELKDPQATPPKAGDSFNMLFQLNPFSIGKLKEFCAPFGDHFGEKNIGILVREKIKDVTIVAQITNRKAKKDSDDPDRVYAAVKVVKIG